MAKLHLTARELVLANLLAHAARHMPADGMVTVTARRESDEVVLAVLGGGGLRLGRHQGHRLPTSRPAARPSTP